MVFRGNKMMQHLNCPVKIVAHERKTYIGTFKAFDKHMNIIVDDCEELRKKPPGVEEKRLLGFVLFRGETIISVTVTGPPVYQPPEVVEVQETPAPVAARPTTTYTYPHPLAQAPLLSLPIMPPYLGRGGIMPTVAAPQQPGNSAQIYIQQPGGQVMTLVNGGTAQTSTLSQQAMTPTVTAATTATTAATATVRMPTAQTIPQMYTAPQTAQQQMLAYGAAQATASTQQLATAAATPSVTGTSHLSSAAQAQIYATPQQSSQVGYMTQAGTAQAQLQAQAQAYACQVGAAQAQAYASQTGATQAQAYAGQTGATQAQAYACQTAATQAQAYAGQAGAAQVQAQQMYAQQQQVAPTSRLPQGMMMGLPPGYAYCYSNGQWWAYRTS